MAPITSDQPYTTISVQKSTEAPRHQTFDLRVMTRMRWLSSICGLITAGFAILSLVSWATGIASLRKIVASRAEMKPNTAMALLTAGIALWLLGSTGISNRTKRWGTRLLAAVGMALGGMTLLELTFGHDLKIDNMVLPMLGLQASTGRMAGHTAVGIFFAGSAVFLLTFEQRWTRRISQVFAVAAGATALIALFGYTFDVSPIYLLGNPAFMALPTAIALASLALGALLATPDHGLLSPLASSGGGGLMLRRILPLAVLAPWVVGWIATELEKMGLYAGQTDDALFALTLMLFLTVLLVLNARSLNRLDAENEQSRETLRRSSEQWQLTFNCMGEGLSYHDPEYNVVGANTAFKNLLGEGFCEGDKCYRLVHGADAPPDYCPMRKTLATGRTAESEIYEPRLGRYLQVRTDPVRDESGKVFRIVHVVEDITDRKKAEDHMRRLATIVESSDDAIYSTDLEGHIQSWNRGAEVIYGYTEQEILGQTPSVLYVPNARDDWQVVHERIMGGDRVENLETRRTRKDGSEFDISLTLSPLLTPDGTVVGCSAIARDITSRKAAEAELKRKRTEAEHARGQLNAVFHSMGEGLYQLDFDGRVVFMNSACERMLGYTLDETRGKSMHDLIHSQWPDGTQRPAHTCPLLDVVVQGEIHHEDEDFFRKKDGTFLPVEYTSSPLIVDGQIHGAVLSFRDISERKRAEEERSRLLALERKATRELEARNFEFAKLNAELEERVKLRTAELEVSNKELEAFSYSVSHDLRAPLRSIDGFSHILLEEYENKLDDEGRDFLNRLRHASQEMGQLIDALLQLSRVSRSEMSKVPVDLSEISRQIAAELSHTAPGREVEFKIADGVTAMGDQRLLHVALQNLISNAWKFTSKKQHARIEFGVAQQDGKSVFFVRDNGAGFEMAYVDKLFGAFQRLHSASEFEGSGIGLATVQRVIRRHGGTVWAEGEPGKGATIYFTL